MRFNVQTKFTLVILDAYRAHRSVDRRQSNTYPGVLLLRTSVRIVQEVLGAVC